ncbi:hypothetical protein BASA81_009638 [Batrachochytrium salamandrivorans]|nr:hypothetical protein BASA81_009638 [Batrachochytrium salamandrivorans]
MVALVQTLIAVMLIPVAFAAPAANGTTPASASKVSTASRTGHYGHLKVSVDGRCGKKAGSNVGKEAVARNLTFVELQKSTVTLAVSQPLVPVIPPCLLDI